MAASKAEIEQALKWAQDNNDDAAIQGLNDMLGQMPTESVLPDEFSPGDTAKDIDPLPSMNGPALAKPSSESDIDAQLEQRQAQGALATQDKPWGEPTQALLDQTQTREDKGVELAQQQYEADQGLLDDPANVPSEDEIKTWLWSQQSGLKRSPGEKANFAPSMPHVKADGRQVLRDPNTGKLRWAAMSSDQMNGKTSVWGALAGAVGSETVNMVGNRIQDLEETHKAVQEVHGFVFDSLSDDEKSRVRNQLAKEFGVDAGKMTDSAIKTKVPPHLLKRFVDENEDNQSIYDSLREGESGLAERFQRAGSALTEAAGVGATHVANLFTPEPLDGVWDKAREGIRDSNPFGADDPEGPIFGSDTASAHWMDEWEKKANIGGTTPDDFLRQILVEPFKAFDPDLQIGASIRYGAEKIKEDAYGEYYERAKKPLLKPGTEFTTEDIFNLDTYLSEEAAATDPIAMLLKAGEQIPNMAPGVGASRLGGKLSGKLFPGAVRGGRTGTESLIREVEALSRKRAMAGGLLGNVAGNSIVYDHAASEIRDTLSVVPDARLMTSPEIKMMMEAGLSFEAAKQLLIQEAAGRAGRNAWAASSAITAPTAALAGMGGGGTLLRKNQTRRVLMALGWSPIEEGVQELVEGEATDMQIERVDPENPMLQDAGRYTERFFSGVAFSFATAAPMEAVAALETSKPEGIDQNTVDAARTTETFFDARNDRFAQELKVTDPNYIKKTGTVRRLEQFEKLQTLQEKEADAIIKMAGPVREYMKNNPSPGRDTDLAMLNSLETYANSQKTDIAIAKNKRTTAKQMLQDQEALFEERAELQRKVNDKLMDLDDVKRLQDNLTSAQEQQPMTNQELSELADEGYIVTVGDSDRPIITPKGRRALKNLGRQRLNLESALNSGFADKERRAPENLARRDQVDNMSEEDRETVLYKDPTTGVQNKRAYKERGEDAPAHATVEVDSLEWVNESMNFAAGDRILSSVGRSIEEAIRRVISTGIKELGDDDDAPQVYRIGGKEFAVTGPNQEAVEQVLQDAASDLSQQTISDGRTNVIPSITWGKGDTPAASIKASAQARRERVNAGTIADRKKPPTNGGPKGSLHLDRELDQVNTSSFDREAEYDEWLNNLFDNKGNLAEDIPNYANADIARGYDELMGQYGEGGESIEVGDIAEILTPLSVQFGTVTKVVGQNHKPRIEVVVDGRRFRFNPERNWLINNPMSSAEDIAWITGDDSYSQDPDSIPQVLEDVQLGLMGKGGDTWYADLSVDYEQPQHTGSWMNSKISPVKQFLPKSTPEQNERAEALRDSLFEGYNNIPKINLIGDIEQFRTDNSGLYDQILAEVRASGGTSLRGVKGYFDHLHPDAGIYIFTANIATGAKMDSLAFEQAIQETVFHETIGHYGIRGVFRNELALRQEMFNLVDAFNIGKSNLAKRMEAQLGLYGALSEDFDPAKKQLLGEEMLAYVIGKQMSGQLDIFTKKQKTAIQKIIDWMKMWLNKFFGQYNEKFVSTGQMQAEFWNDARVQELVVMSTDFARRGPKYQFEQIANGMGPQMRDGDMFQWNVQQIFRTATKKVTGSERKQLAQKYGGKENVPTELPIFPQEGSLNVYKQAVINITKQGNPYGIKAIETELLGLSDDADWNLFRDLTYGELLKLHARSQNHGVHDVDRYWYRDYVPHPVRMELDAIFDALDKMSMVGPIKDTYGALGKEHDKFQLDYSTYKDNLLYKQVRPIKSEPSYQAMERRIGEILNRKVDPKKTKINYDIFNAHLTGSRAYQVYAEGEGGNTRLSESAAGEMLFGSGIPGNGNWVIDQGGFDSLSKEQKEMIREVVQISQSRGADIGLNPVTGKFMDNPRQYSGSWGSKIPAGGEVNEDYRVSLIKTKGGAYPDMPTHDQHFNANFMHIRHSTATFLDAPSWDDFDAANEKYAVKAWFLAELQSDWSSKHRKGFEDEIQRNALFAHGKMLHQTLHHAYVQGIKATHTLVTDLTKTIIEPMLAVKPDYADGALKEQADKVLDAESVRRYGMPMSELTPDQAQELWHLNYMARNKSAHQKLQDSADFITKYLEENSVDFSKMKGTMDARMFDELDQYAANRYLKQVEDAIRKAKVTVSNYGNPAQNFSPLAVHTALAGGISSLIESEPSKAAYRMSWVKDRIKPVLVGTLGPLGATDEQIDNILQKFGQQDVSTYTIKNEDLLNIFYASKMDKLGRSKDGFSQQPDTGKTMGVISEMGNYWSKNFVPKYLGKEATKAFEKDPTPATSKEKDKFDAMKATLADGPIKFSYNPSSDPNNLSMNVTGPPSSVAIFEEYKADFIESWINVMIPANAADVARREDENSGGADDVWSQARDSWNDNNDLQEVLQDEYGGVEYDAVDPTEDERAMLDNHGVQHRDDFYDNHRSDAQDYVRTSHREYMDEDSWDSSGLNEENEHYLTVLEDDGETAADEWLEEERDTYMNTWEESELFTEAVDNELDEQYTNRLDNDNSPYLFVSTLPVRWDTDGEVTESVEFKIVADDIGSSYYIWINGDWKDYHHDADTAWSEAGGLISSYFSNEGLKPPVGAFMGPADDGVLAEANVEKENILRLPNLEILAAQSRDMMNQRSVDTIDLVKGFKQMVEISKKFGGSFPDDRMRYYSTYYPASPMHKDSLWRTTALRYILSDAVRRGFGAVVWNDGLASSTRGGGGVGVHDRTPVQRLDWSKEIVTLGGKEEEVFVLTSPDMSGNIVVTKANMIQVMGVHAAGIMRQQADGKWEPTAIDETTSKIKLPFTEADIDSGDQFVINEVTSATGMVTYTVHDTLDNDFMGFYNSREEAQSRINDEETNDHYRTVRERVKTRTKSLTTTSSTPVKDRAVAETEAIGKRLSQGVIYADDVGSSSIWIIAGDSNSYYEHTFGVPTLAGARANYDKMTVDAWNKELKKYGAKIEFSYIKIPEDKTRTAYSTEGQTGRISASKEAQWASQYGEVEVVQVKEPQRGYVVIGSKKGPLTNNIFTSYAKALRYITDLKESMETNREGSRVFTIVLNDKIKEKFVSPVAPFHRDPRLEEHLKKAKGKFKKRNISLTDRFRAFRQRLRGSFQHEFVDGLYGLKDALRQAGVSDRAYMANRLSTGNDARMKAALYYGYPVWDEDTTQSEGRGLMDIFSGIDGDPELWGMWMAGLRGKELLLEGYDALAPDVQAEIIEATKFVDGDTQQEKIWNLLVANTKGEKSVDEAGYNLTEAEQQSLGEAGSKWYQRNLYHFRRKKDVLTEDGRVDKSFRGRLGGVAWKKRLVRTGDVFDFRKPDSETGKKQSQEQIDLKWQQAIWDLTDDPRTKDNDGNALYRETGKPKPGRYRKYEQAHYYGIETEAEARSIINAVADMAIKKQAALDKNRALRSRKSFIGKIQTGGREFVFEPEQLVALVALGDSNPSFDRVRKEYIDYNSKVLDFAQEAGTINPETRPFWESNFYVPLYRIKDDRLGGMFDKKAGVTDVSKPIKRLEGARPTHPVARVVWQVSKDGRTPAGAKSEFIKKAVNKGYIELNPEGKKGSIFDITEKGREFLIKKGMNVGDIMDNIMMNLAAMIDASVKNHAALMAIDDLKETGMIEKTPMATSTELIPASEVVKIIEAAGLDHTAMPAGFKEGLHKMMAIQAPTGPGVISVLRDGKREYYRTNNMMLYESLTLVNRKTFGENWKWLTMPKRFYTGATTLTPVFMATNAFRDTISASISGRDTIIPFIDSMKGFVSAVRQDEAIRTMTSGGASFESGYITGGDTKATKDRIKRAITKVNFQKTLLDEPHKLAKVGLLAAWESYVQLGSSLENASRIAIYKAAKAAGKSKLRSLYESKDIMDFSMKGNNVAIQTLIATVPFMGARIQGLYRTGRGFKEKPVATLIKGSLYMAAALAVWAQFREDERYKELEEWDKAVYHHFWIGKDHYRLPRAFEVGAIFTTIPEQWLEYMYSQEDDAGKQLLRQWAFMWGETFSLNPIPQAVKPIVEMARNYNYFTGRDIVSSYDKRMGQDQFGPRTSETMRELAKLMPDAKVGKGELDSPKQLANLYRGYTSSVGQYLLGISDWFIRQSMDYPLPPTATPSRHWLTGRFSLGSNPPPSTKYQTEFYRMMEKVTSIQQSISFYERTGIDDDRWDEILDTESAYINVSDDLEDIREDVRELNREEMEIDYDLKMDPDKKRELIDAIVYDRNKLFEEAYSLRPGGANNRNEPAKTESLESLISNFGVNDSEFADRRLKEESPATLDIIKQVRENMTKRNLLSLSKIVSERAE